MIFSSFVTNFIGDRSVPLEMMWIVGTLSQVEGTSFFRINERVSSESQILFFLSFSVTLGMHWSATVKRISLNFSKQSSIESLKKQQSQGALLTSSR